MHTKIKVQNQWYSPWFFHKSAHKPPSLQIWVTVYYPPHRCDSKASSWKNMTSFGRVVIQALYLKYPWKTPTQKRTDCAIKTQLPSTQNDPRVQNRIQYRLNLLSPVIQGDIRNKKGNTPKGVLYIRYFMLPYSVFNASLLGELGHSSTKLFSFMGRLPSHV